MFQTQSQGFCHQAVRFLLNILQFFPFVFNYYFHCCSGAANSGWLSGFSCPYGIAADPSNDVLYVANYNTNSVIRVSSGKHIITSVHYMSHMKPLETFEHCISGSLDSIVFSNVPSRPEGIALDFLRSYVYVASRSANVVCRAPSVGGTR
jgi:DNA-binding beta-propeller fold protein YncE